MRSQPRSLSAQMSALPINPAPPVTSTRAGEKSVEVNLGMLFSNRRTDFFANESHEWKRIAAEPAEPRRLRWRLQIRSYSSDSLAKSGFSGRQRMVQLMHERDVIRLHIVHGAAHARVAFAEAQVIGGVGLRRLAVRPVPAA